MCRALVCLGATATLALLGAGVKVMHGASFVNPAHAD